MRIFSARRAVASPLWLALAVLLSAPVPGQDAAPSDRTIRMARDLAVSPDGQTLVFAWQGDLWRAASTGGAAVRITTHPADDESPAFSPDGRTIAFESDRGGRTQVHTVPIEGGAPRQRTRDSESKSLLGYTADGTGLLVLQSTDRAPFSTESTRVFRIDLSGAEPRRMLLDVGVRDAALSPDGVRLVFTRGRASWTRKGYRGSAAEQLWIADLSSEPVGLERLDEDQPGFMNVSHLWPMWDADGRGVYYVSDPDGTFDVYHRDLQGGAVARITDVGKVDGSDDGVVYPALSADGSTLVFRRRFDLQRLDLASGRLTAVALEATGDRAASPLARERQSAASDVAFTHDGKQMAFVAGNDVYVMDPILKEPRRMTDTPHREDSLAFTHDGKHLYFSSDADGEVDLWRATLTGDDGIWWLEDRGEVAIERITDDIAVESRLLASPTGKHFAYLHGTELWVMDADGSDHRRVVPTWSAPRFDWSPDGKWLCYSTSDDDYNSDVWIVPLDGTRAPYNLSRHPDNESGPVWSPDGSRIAFTGRRDGEESDIYVVTLAKSVDEATDRDRRLEQALKAMQKPKPKGGDPAGDPREPGDGVGKGGGEAVDAAITKPVAAEGFGDPKVVRIDFDGIHDRIQRISNPDSSERGLVWSPDGKKLAFGASVGGARGVYTVEFPEPGKPAKWVDSLPTGGVWLKDGNQVVGAVGGVPAAMDSKGKTTRFEFAVRRVLDWRELRKIAFDQGWRAMRDEFYDVAMNNRDWAAVRAKYREVAGQCLGRAEFSEVMNMMLGELNASHMGHRGGGDPLPAFSSADAWTPTTWHLGLRFALADPGPGLLVDSVIPGGPASLARSRIAAGERVLSIDGVAVGPEADLFEVLTRDEADELEVVVAGSEGTQRSVGVRPVASVRGLLYDEWVDNNRSAVDELSGGRLGYLHIRGMDMSSLRQMEEDLFFAGHGKDGLIVDVRFNGGGSTTDHVLTALTQPRHAITVSRGSGEGYPQDRKVYASWHKPVVVMCNEHSFSNAEILAHAIRTLGRGPVVGMRTAGGVISTGGATLLDGSSVRMPTRGWYLVGTGKDMELNGAMPHVALWNDPLGGDAQLGAAVQALADEVESSGAVGPPRPVPAAFERRRK